MNRLLFPWAAVVALLSAACTPQPAPPPGAHRHAPAADQTPPPLYTDLGTYQQTITTASPQAYFDQGLRLAYSFKTQDMLQLASEALAGEIAVRGGDGPTAAERFAQAVKIQDGHWFTEPPPWYYPVRQSLGAALLVAGRPAEADQIQARFTQAWSRADVTLTASRF